jgi:predicted dehydrogenase
VSAQVRVGVIGAGQIGQAVHLPLLWELQDEFALTALADPSARVREAMAAKFPGLETVADWRRLLEAGTVDAVVVCSPQHSHAEVVLAALDAGIHVLVEKPLCIDLADAEAICLAAERSGLVVQVGYMKRYDDGFLAWCEDLPSTAEGGLRLIEVVTRDPGMARRPFLPRDFVRADDIPRDLIDAAIAAERQQVEAAVGKGDPVSLRAFGYTFLACLVHDVNLVHGALERLGVEPPLPAVSSTYRDDAKGASIAFALPGDGVWNCSWQLLDGLTDFAESAIVFFDDSIHELRFAAPYLRERETLHRRTLARDGSEREERGIYGNDSFAAELRHFHECMVDGAVCRTPPQQAKLDLAALRAGFLARA